MGNYKEITWEDLGGHGKITLKENEWINWMVDYENDVLDKYKWENTYGDLITVQVLTSGRDEPNSDYNHVHYKYKTGVGTNAARRNDFVVCSVKIDGVREINRRKIIENVNVNACAGLNLNYKF